MTTDHHRRQLHLNAFLGYVGHHEAAWRLPNTQADAITDIDAWIHLARVAERGKLDAIFIADLVGLAQDIERNAVEMLDPLVLVSALSTVTERIGLIATTSTTYNEPYNVARRFVSLDHVSKGRAGWNIVTSAQPAEAVNFGLETPPLHEARYDRADEFLEVVRKLWDSWHDDTRIIDKETGRYIDRAGISGIDHVGRYYSVKGPLNVSRAPQGHPVLVQAGSSDSGKEQAARHADVIFTAQWTLDESRAFGDDIRRRAAKYGRAPSSLYILPGLAVLIGATEDEVRWREEELAGLMNSQYGLNQLRMFLQVDTSDWDLDAPLPEVPAAEATEAVRSRYQLVVDLARGNNLNVRQLISRLAGGHGHRVIAGTPLQIADDIERWFQSGAVDGFNIMPAVSPLDLELFVDGVVPILQERGIFRREYAGSTLRDHYGLPRPHHVRGGIGDA